MKRYCEGKRKIWELRARENWGTEENLKMSVGLSQSKINLFLDSLQSLSFDVLAARGSTTSEAKISEDYPMTSNVPGMEAVIQSCTFSLFPLKTCVSRSEKLAKTEV